MTTSSGRSRRWPKSGARDDEALTERPRRKEVAHRTVIAIAMASSLLGCGAEATRCRDGSLSIGQLFSGTCCYEEIRSRCGELSIGPRTSGTTFDAVASKIARAVEREGGTVKRSDAETRTIVARFSRSAELTGIKRRLEALATVRWVSYRPLVQPD